MAEAGAHRRADLRENSRLNTSAAVMPEKKIKPVDHGAGKLPHAARRARCSESGASSGCTLIVESIPLSCQSHIRCYWNETLLALRLLS